MQKANPNPETRTRCDLAACHQLLAHFGMSDLIFTHVSARLSERPNRFLLTTYGLLFDEASADTLSLYDLSGELIQAGVEGAPKNGAAVALHRAILGARADVCCVIHTHTIAGISVSADPKGLRMLCQHAAKFQNRIGRHRYEGIVSAGEEEHRLVKDLGQHIALLLDNHGLLAVGRTVAEAFHTIYHLEMACRVQVAADPNACAIPEEVATATAEQFDRFPQPLGQREWPALLRLASRLTARDGGP